MIKKEEHVVKVFLGDMPKESNNFRVSLFEQKHLKGFLKGQELFQYGRHLNGTPMYYSVSFKYMDYPEYLEYLKTLNN